MGDTRPRKAETVMTEEGRGATPTMTARVGAAGIGRYGGEASGGEGRYEGGPGCTGSEKATGIIRHKGEA